MLQKDIELKLGRFVEFDSDNIVSPFIDDGLRASKTIKAVSEVDSTAILPVKGSIYPDGCIIAWTVSCIQQCEPSYWMDAIQLCQATELKSSTIFVRHVYFWSILEAALCFNLVSNCPVPCKFCLVCILYSILAL